MKTGIKKTEKIKTMVISIVIAVLVWAAVVYINPPEMTTTISNLPVRITGDEALRSKNLTVVGRNNISGLSVTVKGKRNDLLRLSGGIYVDVDVSSIEDSGSYNLTGNVTLPSSKLTVDSVRFDSVPIKIEPVVEKDIDIRVTSAGASGNKFVRLKSDTDKVTVRGAVSEIEGVEYGLAAIDISQISADTSLETGYVLMNKENSLIEKNETIKASKTRIRVECSIYEAITVPVRAELNDALSAGYIINYEETSVTPAAVEIGIKSGLDIRSVTAVVSDVSADTTAVITEEEGMFIPNDVKTVKVKLAADKRVERKVAVNIEARNLSGGLNASITPISVTASGAEKNLISSNITAYVDLEGYGAGEYTLPVALESDTLEFSETYYVTVIIS